MFGSITVKSRPLRLAFLISPTKTALHKAIQINSTLWGGIFNPILPLYEKAPKAWKSYPREKVSAQARVLGYIRAFDPDVLVNATSGDLPEYLRDLKRPIIPVDEIWEDFFSEKQGRAPHYGVGVFELLNGIYKEFFEVKRRFPMTVALPVFPKKHELFWSAVIGQLPPAIQKVVETDYAEAIDIEKPEIGIGTYGSLMRNNIFTPRRITRYGVDSEQTGRGRDRAYAFYMDADKFLDLVDFWNLRALGRAVLPIPKQHIEAPEFLPLIRNYVKAHYGVNRHNPAIDYGTSIIRSSSSTMSELQALANALEPRTLIPDKPDAHALMLQHWYPRIWDEWAVGKDGADPDNVCAQSEEFSFAETDGTVSFNFVRPEFAVDRVLDTPRYANEIYPRFYGEGEKILADILPYDHGQQVLRTAGGFGSFSDEFRIGRTGLIHLVKWKHRTRWTVPLAEDVFFSWLKDKGFDPALSSCGRLAKQMHSQLNGWLGALTYEALLNLFERMNRGGEDGKGLPLGQVKNAIANIPHGNLYDTLVSRGVFQLGYKTQCTHCQRGSWYSLKSFAAELVCPLCHKGLTPINAVDSANKGAWHLRSSGPFSVSNYADGSYSVLLALNFFERDQSLQMTPALSFTGKNKASGDEVEADLGLIWQESVFGETQEGVLFAECKSYNTFELDDFARMRTLAKHFPGAILAFCTLRKKLNAGEIRELRRLTKAGMKRWKDERPLNPVLILTGQELFKHVGAPYCWEDIVVPEWVRHRTHTLLELCNATQAIYLGAPHWDETWNAEFERKRKRRERKKG